MAFDIGSLGPPMAICLSAVGSAIGCAISGMATHGVLTKTDEGHGKYLGMSAAPASQTIYGFVLMILLNNQLQQTPHNSLGIFAIGVFCGIGIMVSAIFQGKVCATGVLASLKKPSLYAKTFLAVGITESFALFTLIGGILSMSVLPK
ncbi:MAG: ATP synthase subunit C [Candidatus Magnetoovum sp. WYHC-5]|nr:ATP synthase subunit C [Candidatus Magnetoovum sp. WYHC-5]